MVVSATSQASASLRNPLADGLGCHTLLSLLQQSLYCVVSNLTLFGGIPLEGEGAMKTSLTSRCVFCGHQLASKTTHCSNPACPSSQSRSFPQSSILRMLLLIVITAAAARVVFCPVPLSPNQMTFLIWAITGAGILLGVTEIGKRKDQ
jgi:hypothetical protein